MHIDIYLSVSDNGDPVGLARPRYRQQCPQEHGHRIHQ